MSETVEKTTVVSTPDHHLKRGGGIYRYVPYPVHTRSGFSKTLLTLLLLAGLTALILYLIYRPSHPRFSVSSVAIYDLRTGSQQVPNVVTSRSQFNLIVRNPNDRASILYRDLYTYIIYRNQPITPPIPLPPLVQERDTTTTVSPVIEGSYVPVSNEVAQGLKVDREFGVVGLKVVMVGRVKYKSGPFRFGWNTLYVRCDVLVNVKTGVDGQVPLIGEPQCKVDA